MIGLSPQDDLFFEMIKIILQQLLGMLCLIMSNSMNWKGTEITLFKTKRKMNINIFYEFVHLKLIRLSKNNVDNLENKPTNSFLDIKLGNKVFKKKVLAILCDSINHQFYKLRHNLVLFLHLLKLFLLLINFVKQFNLLQIFFM